MQPWMKATGIMFGDSPFLGEVQVYNSAAIAQALRSRHAIARDAKRILQLYYRTMISINC